MQRHIVLPQAHGACVVPSRHVGGAACCHAAAATYAAQGVPGPVIAGDASQQQQQQIHDGSLSAAANAQLPAAPAVGTEGQVTASQLQLTQLLGSAGEHQVLLNQPKAHIIARAKLPRDNRLVRVLPVLQS